jgi:4'-phosphopantetheinyl transferase
MDEVHVWRIPLDRPPEEVASCRSLLSPEETRRSEAFHFEKDRRRYAVARGALRLILAGRLGTAPEALRFEVGPHGKPFLAGGRGPGFNLSHCEDLALVAVAAAERAVGVDVERVRPLQDLRSIEERYFSPEEREFLQPAGADRARAFLALWTRREAAAKALGLDLQAALATIKIPVYPPGGTVVLAGLAESGGGPWSLHDLALDSDHIGSLCVQGPSCGIVLHELNSSEFYRFRLR